MLINLAPLYSRLANSSAIAGVSWHQQATWDLLSDPTVDVVINTAVTGDGKSYAAFGAYPDGGVMALYPTNELVRDQQRQLDRYRTDSSFRVQRLTGWDLERWARAAKQSKSETLLDLSDADVLLTNPDLFYYLHQGNYLKEFLKQGKGDRLDLWRQIDERFKAIIFDEFHLYQPSQVSGVLNTLLLMRSVGINHKCIFLSATPKKQLLQYLQLAGLNYKIVDPAANGAYSTHSGIGWRQILQPTELHLMPMPSGYGYYGEGWISENEDLILNFFLEYPDSRGAIILNSIAAVKRVRRKLSKILKPHGFTVSENTGFTDKDEVETAIKAHLIVGTSTLDVGVDFKINFLVFEGHDASTFIQRLGRLGRHEGFPVYRGYALIPNYLEARIAKTLANDWQAKEWSGDRLSFNKAVFSQHTAVNSFNQYYKRWSPVQAIAVGQQLIHKDLDGAYKAEYRQYRKACEVLYGADFTNVSEQCKKWKEEAAQLRINNLIVAEAYSFRGTSSLQCAILDCSTEGKQSLKTQNLAGILSNYDFQILDKKEFIEMAGKRSTLPSWVEHCRFFFKVFGIRESRRKWWFSMNQYSRENFEGRLATVTGLGLYGVEGNQLSRVLASTPLVAFVADENSENLKRNLRLPLHFPLYELDDYARTGYHPYCIAFDQAALMLDAYLGKGEVISRNMIAHHSKQVFESEIAEDEAFMAQFYKQFASELMQEDLQNGSQNQIQRHSHGLTIKL